MRRTFRQVTLFVVAACAAITLCATPAWGQEEGVPTKWMTGVDGGVGLNNTEGIAGLLFQSPAMGPGKYLRFRPAIQAAFTGSAFGVAGLLDLAAEMKIPSSKWTLLFGGGVGVGLKHTSCDCGSSTNSALTAHQMFVGFGHPSGFGIQVRATAGWNHGMEVLASYFFKGK